ncbi:MAG: IS3 family transposase [Gammaproteobacteria bacterium]|nr:IS3 family transposase [Phycisphaerae bacterium]NIQ09959.1 IS3 family transposase [Gammaproteobacteria bacterium]NIR93636.1 IS3 family transposase [Gammaproteobacteria bacterium]NIU08859.1 IS3 family transposase [Phycisphaerae bacterium]NIW45027.1 IS3 family transposase [Gammaproteobacteria bacterium]
MKYVFIHQHREEYTITRMCDVLEVSTSGYYDWIDRPESARSRENRRLTDKIAYFHQRSRGIYGSPKIYKDLVEDGELCSINRVARLMQALDIQSKLARKFVITTDSKNTLAPAPDLLKRDFTVEMPDKAWVSDTTFIPTREGWMYLAVVLELFSRQVIGWAMSNRNNTALVQDALTMALFRRGEVKDVIVHSDQGSTYASTDYQQQLEDHQLRCSMSRKGECLDNAVAESFFGSLKNELVFHEDYRTRAEARQSIFEYIEVFYNRQRRHAFLNYMTPVEYEEKYA